MTLKFEARDLALLLADDVERVVEALNIDVRRRSRRYLVAFAPWSDHHNPKLEIQLYPIPGKWNDWVGCKFGDVFDLVACVLGGGARDRKAAYRWALEYLGLNTRDQVAWDRRRAEAAARAEERRRKAAVELDRNRRAAKAQWLTGHPLEPRMHGWKYLEAREIDLAQLPKGPKGELLVRATRYSPRETWYDEETGRPGHVGPALLSAMTLRDGTFASVHKIWIDPDRPGEKADLDPPRKMWPSSDGAHIRLWQGQSRLKPREAADRGLRERCGVAEGVEDGLSCVLIAPELRWDAAGSLAGLGSYDPPECASEILVAADNDWGKAQAQASLVEACDRLATDFKLPVFVAHSPEGKDFNQLLKGAAA